MTDKRFVLELGKLVIAAAWIDGTLETDELNSLKDLVFSLPGVTGEDWAELEMYVDARVGDEERERLLRGVLDRVRTEEEKTLALDALRRLVESDGRVTEAEASLLEEVRGALEHKSTGLLPSLASLVGNLVDRRENRYRAAANRESRLDDYLRNTVYFQLVSEMEARGKPIDLPEKDVRRLCLAAGLMAQVAWIDEEISDEEKQAIRRSLTEAWGLSREEAELVSEISVNRAVKGLDYYRLTRSFFEVTRPEERRRFLETLFRVANASHKTSNREIEEIRRIAESLKLTNREFVQAKLSVPSEDRHGL
jgi:uncharacterized tellurite resistance protein B-like protein